MSHNVPTFRSKRAYFSPKIPHLSHLAIIGGHRALIRETRVLSNFWQELKRRKVVRVVVVYVIVAWVAIEVSSVLFPALLLPDWSSRLVVALIMVGFPLVVGLAWAFDLTTEGIRKTRTSDIKVREMTPEPDLMPDTTFSPDDRLDGWKRIAIFLNRDVRTVRRWEKGQGLPIRRVMHDKGATVFAYQPDLESWMENRNKLAPKPPPKRPVEGNRLRPAWVWQVVSVIAISLLIYVWWDTGEKKSIPFTDQDWVLITEFDNRTGEAVLDGTVEYALERELNNSQFVKVIARNRVKDALQLMQLLQDTQVDIEIGRQISVRDGDVSILIAGRIDKIGETYSLSTSLINPVDGVTLSSNSEIANTQSDILEAVTRLANGVREDLGEELDSIETSAAKLSKVTTPSLRALQLYSRANDMMISQTGRAKALPTLKQALLADPDFASAHLLLHYLYKDRDDKELAEKHLDRAVALANTTSERERLFIISSKHSYDPKEFRQAIEIGEILAGIYPDHFWAVSNLASLNQVLGNHEQMYRYRLQRANLRPNVGWANLEATFAATVFGQDDVREPYLQKAQNFSDDNWISGNLRLLPFYDKWLENDLEGSLEQLDRIIAEDGEANVLQHPVLSARAKSAYLSLGKIDRFKQLSQLNDSSGWMEALVDYDAGNPETLASYISTSQGNYWDAMLMAFTGNVEQSEAAIANPVPREQLSWPYFRPNFRYLALGELALAKNQPETAIEHFEYGIELLNNFTLAHYLFALNSLARAHQLNNDLPGAIDTLERGTVELPWSIFEPGATYQWMRNQKLLSEILTETGNAGLATEKIAELNRLLTLSDPQHPLLDNNL
jgi:tetratricopeptide (TPR) repeat protein